jgi:tRNA nucleotidyltransferase/poly(A) polymerase
VPRVGFSIFTKFYCNFGSHITTLSCKSLKLAVFEDIGSKGQKVLNAISGIISEKNQKAFIIGGFVRDYFLQRPSKDIDIVVEGSGIELATQVAKKIGNPKVSVFKNFGTAMFKYGDIEFEFVGARKESYQRNSRKPIVEEGSLEDDQNRRDFTINAMAVSLHPDNYGELVDPFHGIRHLNEGLIKTPLDPDITYSDDPLRMMRAIRFATQLDFDIEEDSFQAIKRNKKRIEIISKERIIDELHKIILSEKPSKGFLLLDDCGLLPIIFPEISALKGVEDFAGKKHKDNFYHSLQVLDKISVKTKNLWLRWVALVHDIGKPPTKSSDPKIGWTFHNHDYIGSKMIPVIFKRMRLPLNEHMKYVQKLVQLHLRPIALVKEDVTDSAVRRLLFEASNDIEDLMLLAEADITSKNDEKVKRFLSNFKILRQKIKEVEEKDAIRNFQPPISGELIIKTFNLKPCKTIGDIKNSIKEAILDGIIPNSYEEAYAYMLKLGKEQGLTIDK